MRCDQCQMLSINGVACHEHGCPNRRAQWNQEEQAWVKYYECQECGDDVPQGSSCNCSEIDWEPEAEELEEEIG